MSIEEYFTDFTRRDWEDERADGTVRVAVIGVGEFARTRVLPAIEAGRYCETTVLVSGSHGRATEVAESFGVERVVDYDEYRAGGVEDAHDAVYVATPNALHGEYVTAAAEQGKHVLCEKPLATASDRARQLVETCGEAGVTLMTAYRLQTEPAIRRTREIVRSGTIGDVVQIHGNFSHPLLRRSGPNDWRLSDDLAGGGALVDLGIYPLNTSRFLLESDPTAVSARTHSFGEAFAEVDEHVEFTLEFPTGTTASCTASLNAHPSSRLFVVGTNGMISISAPFGGVVPQDIVVERGEFCMEYAGPPVDEVEEELDYFGYCALTGTEPEPNGEDGVEDLRVIEAAYESAEVERWVTLEAGTETDPTE